MPYSYTYTIYENQEKKPRYQNQEFESILLIDEIDDGLCRLSVYYIPAFILTFILIESEHNETVWMMMMRGERESQQEQQQQSMYVYDGGVEEDF